MAGHLSKNRAIGSTDHGVGMSTGNPHWTHLETLDDDVEHQEQETTRAVCSCGWESEWFDAPILATEAGLTHTSAAVVPGG